MIPLRHQRGHCGVARDALSTSRGGAARCENSQHDYSPFAKRTKLQ